MRPSRSLRVLFAVALGPAPLAAQVGESAPQQLICMANPLRVTTGIMQTRYARSPRQAQMPDRDFRLFAAVAEGPDHLEVQRLLREGASPEASDPDGETPLTVAARFNNPAAANALLDAGANANRRNEKRFSPLALASFCGHEQVAGALMDHGALVNEAEAPMTPLMAAASAGRARVVRDLLARGADVMLRSATGVTASSANAAAAAAHRTMRGSVLDSILGAVPLAVRLAIDSMLVRAPATAALMRAARSNDLAGARAALQARGNPAFRGRTTPSPLGVAVELDNIAMVRLMLAAAGPEVGRTEGELEWDRGHAKSAAVLGLLLTTGPKAEGEQRDRLVRWIVQQGDTALVRGLLVPGSGITPSMVLTQAHEPAAARVALAIIAGPDTSWFESAGEFAISASSPGEEGVLRAITQRAGRRSDSRTRSGPPVLHYALMEQKFPLFKAVLEAGADPNVRYDGMSVLVRAYAMHDPDAVALLRAHGAASPVDDAALIAAAIDANDGEQIRVLMRGGLDVLSSGVSSRPPLQTAVENGKGGGALRAMLADARVAARVTGASDHGYSLVERVMSSPTAGYGRGQVVAALMEIGVPTSPPGSTGLSPIVAAAAQDRTSETLRLLATAGVRASGVTPAGSSVICLAISAWAQRRDREWMGRKIDPPMDMIVTALEAGADLNVATCELPEGVRGSVLHLLALRRTTNITEAYRTQREAEDDLVRYLLANGADPLLKSSTGERAEQVAKRRKDEPLVRLLRAAPKR